MSGDQEKAKQEAFGPPSLAHRIEEARALQEVGQAKLIEAVERSARVLEVSTQKIKRLEFEIAIELARVEGAVAEEDFARAQSLSKCAQGDKLEAELASQEAECRIAAAKSRFDDANAKLLEGGTIGKLQADIKEFDLQEVRCKDSIGKEVVVQSAKEFWAASKEFWAASEEERREYLEDPSTERFGEWRERRAKEQREEERLIAFQRADERERHVEFWAASEEERKAFYAEWGKLRFREWRRAKENCEARSGAEKTSIELIEEDIKRNAKAWRDAGWQARKEWDSDGFPGEGFVAWQERKKSETALRQIEVSPPSGSPSPDPPSPENLGRNPRATEAKGGRGAALHFRWPPGSR